MLPCTPSSLNTFHGAEFFLDTKIPVTSPNFMENKISSRILKYQSLEPKLSHINLVAILPPQILTTLLLSVNLCLSLPAVSSRQVYQ